MCCTRGQPITEKVQAAGLTEAATAKPTGERGVALPGGDKGGAFAVSKLAAEPIVAADRADITAFRSLKSIEPARLLNSGVRPIASLVCVRHSVQWDAYWAWTLAAWPPANLDAPDHCPREERVVLSPAVGGCCERDGFWIPLGAYSIAQV
jgi:hypothetical protein